MICLSSLERDPHLKLVREIDKSVKPCLTVLITSVRDLVE